MTELKLYAIDYYSTLRGQKYNNQLLIFAKNKDDAFEQFSKDIIMEKVNITSIYEAEIKEGSVVWNRLTIN